MIELLKYIECVARRKSINRNSTSQSLTVNHAIVMQLEEHDIPTLTEIIRVLSFGIEKALEEIGDEAESVEELIEVESFLLRAKMKAEELSVGASHGKWGPSTDEKSN